MTIADASPLIALVKMRRLVLLSDLFGTVSIGPAVRREALDQGLAIGAPGVDMIALAVDDGSIQVVRPSAKEKNAIARILRTSRLHEGEVESVVLAQSRDAMVILDDREARTLAAGMRLPYIGTAGVLLEAHARGHLAMAALEDAVKELSRTIWMSPAVVAEMLKRAKGRWR